MTNGKIERSQSLKLYFELFEQSLWFYFLLVYCLLALQCLMFIYISLHFIRNQLTLQPKGVTVGLTSPVHVMNFMVLRFQLLAFGHPVFYDHTHYFITAML